VGLYVGSQISQVELQVLSPSVEVAKTGQLVVTIDPSVGTNMVRSLFRKARNREETEEEVRRGRALPLEPF